MNSLSRKNKAPALRGEKGAASGREIAENDIQIGRRKFMRALALGTSAFAMSACGGGGSGSVSTQDSTESGTNGDNAAPIWATVPSISFTEGIASTISIAAYVSDTHSLAITKNAAALPPGVTYDAASKSFVYDGIGRVNSTDGHVLTATEV